MDAITASEAHWRYSPPANTQAKVLLLTKARTATIGRWHDGLGVLAWCPLPKRDKKFEETNNL